MANELRKLPFDLIVGALSFDPSTSLKTSTDPLTRALGERLDMITYSVRGLYFDYKRNCSKLWHKNPWNILQNPDSTA